MTQDRYVTSKTIRGIGTEIGDDVVPQIRELRALVDSTELGGVGWGLVGEPAIGLNYCEVQKNVREDLARALDVLESWQDTLDTAAANWRTAEINSTVVYQ